MIIDIIVKFSKLMRTTITKRKLGYKTSKNKWQGPALGARSCSINKLENFRRTENREQTDRQRFQLQRPLLSPVDRRGERANMIVQS